VQTVLWVLTQQIGARDQAQAGGDHRTGLFGPREAVAVRPQCRPEVPGTRRSTTVRRRPVRRAHSCSLVRNGSFISVLIVPRDLWDRIVAHCLDGLPLEACGLLAGRDGEVCEVYPAANAARSARVYPVEPRDLLHADRAADAAGLSLIGVWHSHTHSPAYPSPTDVAQAPDPDWHYVIVSLSDLEPVLRSYRVVAGAAEEEAVVVSA
jgi:proteasome lid subunit RPN8/RPN11